MSDSVRPHRRQPTKLPRPWDSPGKNTGVGCHFRLQCMKVKRESEVAQLCPTLSDPIDGSPPSSSVHGIFQARVVERHWIQAKQQLKLTVKDLTARDCCWTRPTPHSWTTNSSLEWNLRGASWCLTPIPPPPF